MRPPRSRRSIGQRGKRMKKETAMPIRIPNALPATAALDSENIFVMTEFRALHQDIRPLHVLILNLMPTKIATETQIMRKLSNTPLQIEVELLRTATHDAKNVSEAHLETFYRTFEEVEHEHFDGLIITGAPVEQLDFEDVDYWPELQRIMDWSVENVHTIITAYRSASCPRSSRASMRTTSSSGRLRSCAASMTASTPCTRATPRSGARMSRHAAISRCSPCLTRQVSIS